MSMDREPNVYNRDSVAPARDPLLDTPPTLQDRETRVYDRDMPRKSNTLAYLIGGLVLALGLLAFLFYDGNRTGDVSTTGSTSTQTERPAAPMGTTPATPAPAAPVR